MFVTNPNIRLTLTAPLAPGDTLLPVDAAQAAALNTLLGTGNYTYLRIVSPAGVEIVRAVANPSAVPIVRAQGGTTELAAPVGACALSDTASGISALEVVMSRMRSGNAIPSTNALGEASVVFISPLQATYGTPNVVVTALTAASHMTYAVTTKSHTGFTVRAYDAATGVAVPSGTILNFDWIAAQFTY